jgi:hypothetical protein
MYIAYLKHDTLRYMEIDKEYKHMIQNLPCAYTNVLTKHDKT